MSYLPAIGQHIAEILRFNDFQLMAVSHVVFLKFEILTGLTWPLCVIASNFVVIGKPLLSNLNLMAFSRMVVRYFGFLNFNG